MAVTTAPPVTPRQDAPAGPAPRPRKKRQLAPLWLLSPAGIVLLVVMVAPIVFLVFTSFTNYDQRSLFTGAYESVGLQQYVALFTDSASPTGAERTHSWPAVSHWREMHKLPISS